MNKYKPGDRVFWKGPDKKIFKCIVISPEEAMLYKGHLDVKKILNLYKNVNPTFVRYEDRIDWSKTGWLHESSLYPLTKASLILFGD